MLGELHCATTEKLTVAGVDPQIVGSLAPLFQDCGKFGQSFQGLETTESGLFMVTGINIRTQLQLTCVTGAA